MNDESHLPGRILRVKQGSTPNSSSIGSSVPAFLALAVGSGAATVFLLNLLDTTRELLRRDPAAPALRKHGPGEPQAEDDRP